MSENIENILFVAFMVILIWTIRTILEENDE